MKILSFKYNGRNLGLLKELKDKKVQLETEEMSLIESLAPDDEALLKSLGFSLYYKSGYHDDLYYYILSGENNSQIVVRSPEQPGQDWNITLSDCSTPDIPKVIDVAWGPTLRDALNEFCK